MTLVYVGIGIAVLFIVLLFTRKPIPEPPENVSDEEICSLARQGKKIQAIKWYREVHGVGLKDAKESVERMMRGG